MQKIWIHRNVIGTILRILWWISVPTTVGYIWIIRDWLSALGVCFIINFLCYISNNVHLKAYESTSHLSWWLGLQESYQASQSKCRQEMINNWKKEDEMMTKVMIENSIWEYEQFGETLLPDTTEEPEVWQKQRRHSIG